MNRLVQPKAASSRPPTSGATAGTVAMAMDTRAMARTAAAPVCRSRTTARGITSAAQPPTACRARAPTSEAMLVAMAAHTLAQTNSAIAPSSTGRRP